jgi:hypothetical protein
VLREGEWNQREEEVEMRREEVRDQRRQRQRRRGLPLESSVVIDPNLSGRVVRGIAILLHVALDRRDSSPTALIHLVATNLSPPQRGKEEGDGGERKAMVREAEEEEGDGEDRHGSIDQGTKNSSQS